MLLAISFILSIYDYDASVSFSSCNDVNLLVSFLIWLDAESLSMSVYLKLVGLDSDAVTLLCTLTMYFQTVSWSWHRIDAYIRTSCCSTFALFLLKVSLALPNAVFRVFIAIFVVAIVVLILLLWRLCCDDLGVRMICWYFGCNFLFMVVISLSWSSRCWRVPVSDFSQILVTMLVSSSLSLSKLNKCFSSLSLSFNVLLGFVAWDGMTLVPLSSSR